MLATLALDGERILFTMPRREGRRPDRAMFELSLLLDVDTVLGDRRPFPVVGRESVSCTDFFRRGIERRIHDGDNLSAGDCPVDMMKRDIEGVWYIC